MGTENNECVIATTWSNEVVADVRSWVDALSGNWPKLFAFIPSIVNGKTTIVMGPDGSKKGWDTAEKGENLRNMFLQYLESFNYEDGSNPFDWVEVGYGEFGQKILRGNCINCYNDLPYATDDPAPTTAQQGDADD